MAENSGLSSIDTLTELKAQQVKENKPYLGVDCVLAGTNDMKKQGVIESLLSKKEQILLATQVCYYFILQDPNVNFYLKINQNN